MKPVHVYMAVISLVTFCQPGIAGDTDVERATLIGIESLYVVMDFDSEADSSSERLSGSSLLQVVENKLRQANITTLTEEEYDGAETPPPWLYVRVRIIAGHSEIRHVFSVYVAVVQPAIVTRTMELTFGTTWFLASLGYSDGVREIRESVQFNVDRFISALNSVGGG